MFHPSLDITMLIKVHLTSLRVDVRSLQNGPDSNLSDGRIVPVKIRDKFHPRPNS